MSKPFCYEFYPGEALRQIRFFTPEQKACYLDIISSHIENPRFSKSILSRVTSILPQEQKDEFFKIFEQDQDGFYIEWIYTAIEKRNNYVASRSSNKKGKSKITTKTHDTSYQNDMVNVYVNEDGNKIKTLPTRKEKTLPNKPESIDQVINFFKEFGLNGKSENEANEFWDWYTNSGWTQGKAKIPLKDWKAAARKWARPKLQTQGTGRKIIYPSKN